MNKIKITKTAHPLPFFHLSPTDFERLCFWVIHDSKEFDIVQHYGGMGDSGRDVIAYKEFTTPKREMWYFQCKHYKRIGFSHFKKEIDKLEEHTRLSLDFRPDVVIFVTGCNISAQTKTNTVKYSASKGFQNILFWGKTELDRETRRYPQIVKVFFDIGYKPFSKDLFMREINQEIGSKIGTKYIPQLYVHREFEPYLEWFTLSSLRFQAMLDGVKEVLANNKELIRLAQSVDYIENLTSLLQEDQKIATLLERIVKNRTIDVGDFIKSTDKLEKWASDLSGNYLRLQSELPNMLQKRIRDPNVKNRQKLQDLGNELRRIVDVLQQNISIVEKLHNTFKIIATQFLLIVEKAGYGKTNLLCDFCNRLIKDKEYPIIFLSGRMNILDEYGIESYLLKALGIDGVFSSFNEFLEALNGILATENKLALIALDGINENRNLDLFNEALASFLNKISQFPRVKVVLTCRDIYFGLFTFQDRVKNIATVRGMMGAYTYQERIMAVKRYFDFYKIKCSFSYEVEQHLSNPLLLRFFCEAYGEPARIKRTELGHFEELRMREVFETYLRKKYELMKDRRPTKFRDEYILSTKLVKLGEQMFENGRDYLEYEEIPSVFEEDIESEDSLYLQVLGEEIIFEERPVEDRKLIYFAYEHFLEFIVAKYLTTVYERDPRLLERKIRKLMDGTNPFPKSHGALAFLCCILKEDFDFSLWEYSTKNAVIAEACLDGIVSLEENSIDEQTLSYITEAFHINRESGTKVIDILLSSPRSLARKINITLLPKILSGLSKKELDLSLGMYAIENEKKVENFLSEFVHLLKKENEDAAKRQEMLKNMAEVLIFILGITVVGLRYRCTELLYRYSRDSTEDILELFEKHWLYEDLYIRERIFAVIYAISIFAPDKVVSMSRKIFETFLNENCEYYTTHFMIRQYVKDILLNASRLDNTIFDSKEIAAINATNMPAEIVKKVWRSARPEVRWTGFQNYPILMDMKTYIYGSLAHYFNKHRCDATDEALKILEELGYERETYDFIDGKLQRRYYGRSGNLHKIERFGKKYAWQAYRILQGKWIDELPFTEENYYGYLAFSDREFDPLFPMDKRISKPQNINLLQRNSRNLDEWLEEKAPHKIEGIIFSPDRKWIVTDGFILESDDERDEYIFIRSACVSSEIAEKFKEKKDTEMFHRDIFPELRVPHDAYVHEIPLAIEEKEYFDPMKSESPAKSFGISGHTEFRLNRGIDVHTVRADFIKTMKLQQELGTLNFRNEEKNIVILTQSWGEEFRDSGSWILVDVNTVKEYLKTKELSLYTILFGERRRQNKENIPDFDYDIHHFQDSYLLDPREQE